MGGSLPRGLAARLRDVGALANERPAEPRLRGCLSVGGQQERVPEICANGGTPALEEGRARRGGRARRERGHPRELMPKVQPCSSAGEGTGLEDVSEREIQPVVALIEVLEIELEHDLVVWLEMQAESEHVDVVCRAR